MKLEIYQDRRKEWRWRLRARNGNIMAVASEGYKNFQDCTDAVDSIAEHFKHD